jgi:hypothetical protein
MNGKLTVILLPETLENNKINATIFRGIRLTIHAFRAIILVKIEKESLYHGKSYKAPRRVS